MKAFIVHDIFKIARFTDTPCTCWRKNLPHQITTECKKKDKQMCTTNFCVDKRQTGVPLEHPLYICVTNNDNRKAVQSLLAVKYNRI